MEAVRSAAPAASAARSQVLKLPRGVGRVTPARLTKAMRAALASQDAQQIVVAALTVLEQRAKYERSTLSSPQVVRDYLRLKLADLEHEVFAAVWLDSQNRALEFDELFRGTLAQTSVYPREVVKRALRVNAAGVIFAHNHPSGVAEPSAADQVLTEALKRALALVDVKVLDHFVIGGSAAVSFVERGLL